MKLHLPKLLLSAVLALVATTPAIAVWNEDSQHYYVCDGGGVYRADYTPVNKSSYDISATDAHVEISNSGEGIAVMNGDVILNGGGTSFGTGEKFWTLNKIYTTYYKACIGFYGSEYYEAPNYAKWHISGSLTIKSDTAIFFWNEATEDYNETTGWGSWKSDYAMPDTDDYIIRCGSVDASTVSRLKPYLIRDDYSDNWDTGAYTGGAWLKSLSGYTFYATTGEGGYSYIYLTKSGSSGGGTQVPANAIIVGKDKTVELGGSEATTPSAQKPVYIQGGTADASSLADSLMNNQVIGGDSGTLETTGLQTMTLQGSGSVNYSIVPTKGAASAAQLEIGKSGEKTILELNGANYKPALVNVNGGTVSVSEKTTVGLGSGLTNVAVKKGSGLTNYGKIEADILAQSGSTVLNVGSIIGDIEVESDAIFTNNGSIAGRLDALGKVYGSGSFAETVLASGALLHVGNSPGYQKHTSLTIERGATLSFNVDGIVAATAEKNGGGTYSVLETETLTLGEGPGTVKVLVNVTMGILAAGANPFEIELIDAETGNAKEGDFSITLNSNDLLDGDSEVRWDAASQSLILSGSVSQEALAVLMDTNSANFANTMWASANAVQEMARTAESQFLVGMPGQTTMWGAGIGSFMDVGGKQGFTSNVSGFAVGVQHAFTESFRMGVALGQTFGDFKSDDRQLKVDQTAAIPTLTAQYVTALNKSSSLSISGHVAYGVVENEADTYQAGSMGEAEWDDDVFNVGLRASWNNKLSDNSSVSLFTGLTYQHVNQDSFLERLTDGAVREYRSGSMNSLSVPLGVTLRSAYNMGGTNVFAPELTLAYICDVSRDNPEVKSNIYGFSKEGKGTNIGRNAFMLNVGANWMFDSTWSVGAFYTLEARSHQVNQSVNAALRYSF